MEFLKSALSPQFVIGNCKNCTVIVIKDGPSERTIAAPRDTNTTKVRTFKPNGDLDLNIRVESYDYGYRYSKKQRVRVYEADGDLIFNGIVETSK